MSKEYLSMFIDETREHLQAWSDGMINMEKTGDLTAVATIFRAAHTIKGMAMTMGYKHMGEVTHKAENLLDDLRNNKLMITTPVVDALLHALDMLEMQLDDIEATEEESDRNIQPIIEELTAVREGRAYTSAAKSAVQAAKAETAAAVAVQAVDTAEGISDQALIRKIAEKAMDDGFRIYEILIGFTPECIMPLARFAQWLQRIDQDSLLFTNPDSTILDAGDYTGDITAVIAAREDFEVVGETLADISEVVVRSIQEWTKNDGDTYVKSGNLLPQEGHITDDEHVRKVIEQALKQDFRVFEVGVLLAETCQMKTARIFMVFEAIGGQNHLLYTNPHVQQIEQEQMGRDVLFVMWSKEDLQTVQKAIQSISEVDLVELREWSKEGEETQRGPNMVQKTEQQKTTTTEKRKMSTVRVDTEKLDDLMNLVSELAIDKTRLERIRTEVPHTGLSETVDHMSRLSSQLQELIMSIRMVPVETVFNRFPRMVRDTSQQLGKEVDFTIVGQDTELDRTVVEEIGDPIMHMLRNSLDHGIESIAERRATGKPDNGHIELRAYAAGNHVFIEVEDDGHGINRDKVFKKALEKGLVSSSEHLTDHQVYQLLFASGFSTADAISDLSGRGVGLDVVKSKIESLSGKVDVFSEEGKGTKFVVRLPMTLAIMDGLMVKIGDHPYLIPIGSITETGVLRGTQTVNGSEVVIWRDRVVPIIRARNIFNESASHEEGFVVFVNRGDKVVGIVVDELLGQFEVVLKTLDQRLKKIPYFAGATILGDGEVSLIIDANAFID